MPAHIDAEVVAQVAWLARVRLQPDEAVRLEHDLRRILDHVAELQAVDTTGIEPMLHPHEQTMPLRPDVTAPSLGAEVALRNAPISHDGSFVVPRVVGQGT
jgi:aspartyl-tRNA(Asn)/glutamyl-tRNA(Gln) amidotransferase subunit C